MLLSFIVPTKYIKRFGKSSDFTLALSHLINRDTINDYEKAILELNIPIWLDNGAFERGIPDGIDDLFIKAKKINAELIFAPDFFNDKIKTEKALNNYFYVKERYHPDIKVKTAAIVQADNLTEYLELFESYLNNDKVDVIGINHLTTGRVIQREGKRYTKKEPFELDKSQLHLNRIKLLEIIDKKFKLSKPVHLLGLGDSYEDVIISSQKFPWVISNDSSSCFWNAIKRKKILEDGSVEGGKREEPVDFFFKRATNDQLLLANYNINKIKSLIN